MIDAPILLDTCAVIWLSQGERIRNTAAALLDEAFDSGREVFVSPITAWEAGMLASRGRLALPLAPHTWFQAIVDRPDVTLAAMPASVLVASNFLPGQPPRDPADRIIAASAREFGYRVMTRDRLLLDYAEQGHLQAVAC